jgi:hypothetical protein
MRTSTASSGVTFRDVGFRLLFRFLAFPAGRGVAVFALPFFRRGLKQR